MSALGRTAVAVAGSLASAAAVAMPIIVPVHHTPAGNGLQVTAGTAAITRGSGGSGQSSAGAGSTGAAGAGGTAGTGSAGAHTVHPIIAAFPHLSMTLVTTIPSPTGTIGDPNAPCMQGYVWRQAYAGDYVCVTPAARAAAAYDNSQAANRVALLDLWVSDCWRRRTQASQAAHCTRSRRSATALACPEQRTTST